MTPMIEVKVAELSGPALRYAVAAAMGLRIRHQQRNGVLAGGYYAVGDHYGYIWTDPKPNGYARSQYGWSPDCHWNDCGPLIDKYKPWISPPVVDVFEDQPVGWDAEVYDEAGNDVIGHAIGCPTALVAVCRAIVLAKLGETVSVPAELVQGGAV